MLRWMIIDQFPDAFIIAGITVLVKYLDDFFAGHKTQEGAWIQYNLIKYAFNKYGMLTQDERMTIPTQRLKYIGYIFDTKQQQLEIPSDKIVKTGLKGKQILNKAKNGQKVMPHDVSQFIGIVRHATNVQYYIIPYLRRLEETVTTKRPKQEIKIKKEMQIDVKMLLEAMKDPERNKIKFKWLLYPKDEGDIVLETDASTGY